MDCPSKKCKNSNISIIWLEKFKQKNLTIVDIRNYWKNKVPVLFDINYHKNCLDFSFDENKINVDLINPLDQFICNSENVEEVYKNLKKSDRYPKLCGKIFKSNELIYSCKDCAVDLTCVRCIDCFKNSSHKNHKYKINISDGGGFCDCGDVEAWKLDPYCEIHSKSGTEDKNDLNYDKILTDDMKERFHLITIAVVNYCIEILSWENTFDLPDDLAIQNDNKFALLVYNDEIHTFDQVIQVLCRIFVCDNKTGSDYATIIDREGRAILRVDEFNICNGVRQLIKTTSRFNSKPVKAEVKRVCIFSHQEYALRLLDWLGKILSYCEEFRYIFGNVMQSKNVFIISNEISKEESTLLETILLNDVILWKTARNKWHQLLINGMLMNSATKKIFVKTYTRLYCEILQEFIKDNYDFTYSITHFSIQVYSVPTLAYSVIEEDDAFYIITRTFIDECQKHVENNRFSFKRSENLITSFKRSHIILMDLKYLLLFKPSIWNDNLRKGFLHGFEELLRLFMYMQDMDTIVRQIGQHVEFEPDWQIGIGLQLKCSSIITLLLKWCSSDETVLLKSLSLALKALKSKMNKITYTECSVKGIKCNCIDYDVSYLPVTIHLTLTRIVSGLFLELTKYNINFKDLNSSLSPVELMELPLRTLVMISQFRTGMWKRNGYSLINQIYHYHSVNLRDEMYDRDIIMLQYIGCLLPSDEFLIHLLNKFGLISWAIEEYESLDRKFEEDSIRQTVILVQEFLNLLLIIVNERYTPGVGQIEIKDKLKKEIIHLLCIEPMTHSVLIKNLSKMSVDFSIENIIEEVATFKKQNNGQGGKYNLKEEFYKEFNPFFYHYSRQDQCSAEKMEIRRKKANKEQLICCPPPVPCQFTQSFLPLRNILQSDIFLHLIKIILKRVSGTISASFSEAQYEEVLHLIGLALHEEEYEILKNKKNDSNSFEIFFDFTSKFEKLNLLNLLEICKNSSKVSLHKDLTIWVIIKYKKVLNLRTGMDKFKKLNFAKSDISNTEIVEKKNESKKNSTLAADLRTKIMTQMSDMQSKFIQINPEYFNENQDDKILNETESQQNSDNLILINSDPIALGVHQRGKFFEPEIYFCILCREHEDHLDNKNCMVLASFIQKSTVLSKNRKRNIYKKVELDLKTLPLAMSADLYSGIQISTCGHIMHLECWSDFHSSVVVKERRRPFRKSFDIDNNEYLCPLCECLCNTVMPIVSNTFYRNNLRNTKTQKINISIHDWLNITYNLVFQAKSYSTDKNYKLFKPNSFDDVITNLNNDAKKSLNSYIEIYTENASKEKLFNKHLKNSIMSLSKSVTSIEFSTLQYKVSDDRYPLSLFWACAFTIQTLEKLLCEENATLIDLPSRRYTCLQVLVRCCSVSSIIYDHKIILSYCTRLLQYLLINEQYNLNPLSILDLDAFSLLVCLILTNPSMYINNGKEDSQINNLNLPLANVLDQYIVQIILLFHIVQIILTQNEIYEATPMDTDDQSKNLSNNETRCIASFYIDLLKAAGIKSSFVDSDKIDNCVAERIARMLRSSLLPFLRCCTLFFHFLTEIVTPEILNQMLEKVDKSKNEDDLKKIENLQEAEFIILCEYLSLPKKLSELFSNKSLVSLAQSWARHPKVNLIIKQNIKSKNLDDSQSLLSLPLKLIKQPHSINRLIDLPDDYTDLINNAPYFPCHRLNSDDSRSPTICLVCGAKLCSQSYCCQKILFGNIIVGACVFHAHECGAGSGIFLRIKECKVLLLAQKFKGCYIDAPYIDEYEEPDHYLQRGNPLHLSKKAYKELNKLWLQHGIPERISRAMEQSSAVINWQIH